MKRSKFSEAQIALVLKQADADLLRPPRSRSFHHDVRRHTAPARHLQSGNPRTL